MKQLLLVIAVVMLAAPVRAADAGTQGTKPPRDIKVDFDDDLIEGSSTAPDISVIDSQVSQREDPIIQIRQDFTHQAMQSVAKVR